MQDTVIGVIRKRMQTESHHNLRNRLVVFWHRWAARALSLEGVDNPERAFDVTCEFLRVDLVGCCVSHVLTMMVLFGIVVDLIQFVVKGVGGMCISVFTNFLDDLAKPILPGLEVGRVSDPAMGFEDGAHFANEVKRISRAGGHIVLQVVDVLGRPALTSAFKVHGHDLYALCTVIGEGERNALGRRCLVPNLLEESRVV